jgi:methyl acetate hydrolase
VSNLLGPAVEEGDVPGVVACTTDRSGITYEGAFGSRVLGQPAAMTPDTVVWIASITKAVTSVAALQPVERGKLSLDTPAKAVVPYLGEVGVLEGFDGAAIPRTRRPRRDSSLKHLLTHTVGRSCLRATANRSTSRARSGWSRVHGRRSPTLPWRSSTRQKRDAHIFIE